MIKKENLLRVVLLAVGIVMILVGIYRGELYEIMKKAVVACLECIGIG
ncbi:MAG: thioredoxin [Oscillospiraceae bacterium]|nr:thioredoxin [Oscillospiraceae bacterium]